MSRTNDTDAGSGIDRHVLNCPDERSDLPAQDALRWRARALMHSTESTDLELQIRQVDAELQATMGTLSWQLTAPVRQALPVARGLRRQVQRLAALRSLVPGHRRTRPVPDHRFDRVAPRPHDVMADPLALESLLGRLEVVRRILLDEPDDEPSTVGPSSHDLSRALAEMTVAARQTRLPLVTVAWFALAAARADRCRTKPSSTWQCKISRWRAPAGRGRGSSWTGSQPRARVPARTPPSAGSIGCPSTSQLPRAAVCGREFNGSSMKQRSVGWTPTERRSSHGTTAVGRSIRSPTRRSSGSEHGEASSEPTIATRKLARCPPQRACYCRGAAR